MIFKRVGLAVGLFVAATGIVTANDLQNADPASCMVNALSGYLTSAPIAIDGDSSDAWVVEDAKPDDDAGTLENAVITDDDIASVDPRQELQQFAMQLLDIRYRRGGRVPATGFDCSGFVHYVFAQVFGVDLPGNSAEQYHVGKQIARTEMKVGDLVFFKTHGKRISHVGIYLGEGRFIHSPTTGERVRVSNLAENYWARRFAGARRPNTLI
jgi:cell wall-associated NlpC family hydrolase